jgi:hypothetical protein
VTVSCTDDDRFRGRSAVDVSVASARTNHTSLMPVQVGKLGARPAGSSALLSAKTVSCAPAFLGPLGGSRFLVSGISERRPDTQIALPVRLRTDQTVAKCFGFLARPELGDDLTRPTVDDDEILQGAELWRRTHQTPCSMLTESGGPTWDRRPRSVSCSAEARQLRVKPRRVRRLDAGGPRGQ